MNVKMPRRGRICETKQPVRVKPKLSAENQDVKDSFLGRASSNASAKAAMKPVPKASPAPKLWGPYGLESRFACFPRLTI